MNMFDEMGNRRENDDFIGLWFLSQLPFKPFDGNTRIIILNSKDITYGILVDQILEVLKVESDQKAELPKIFRNEARIGYANKIIRNGDQLFINFDFDKIRTESEATI